MLSWLAKTDGEQGKFIEANRHPSGGNCFVLTTPGGDKLAGGNGSHGVDAALKEGLEKWDRLSADERRALSSGEAFKPPEARRCTPPPGSLVVATFVRNLKRPANGKLARITREDLGDKEQYPGWNPVYTEPARYNFWLKQPEWQSLVPSNPAKGQVLAIPESIRWRILRYHLVDGTYGLPGYWERDHIRSSDMTLTVEEVSPKLRMRLAGKAVMEGRGHGYEPILSGVLEYDPAKKTFSRFDVVAIGDCWGGDWEGGRFKRPGRAPLGVAFRLVTGKHAADQVPPLVHMDRQQVYEEYFEADQR